MTIFIVIMMTLLFFSAGCLGLFFLGREIFLLQDARDERREEEQRRRFREREIELVQREREAGIRR
jgi:hypothetical protein